MKKKIAIMIAAVALFGGTVAAPMAQAGNGIWDRLVVAIGVLLGEGDNKVPCYSSIDCPEGCTGKVVVCSTCTLINGYATGGKGECTSN